VNQNDKLYDTDNSTLFLIYTVYFEEYMKRMILKYLKIYIDENLKIILLDHHQNYYVGNSSMISNNIAKSFYIPAISLRFLHHSIKLFSDHLAKYLDISAKLFFKKIIFFINLVNIY